MKITQDNPNYAQLMGEVKLVKDRVNEMAGEVAKFDNADKVDLNDKKGEVLISRDAILQNGMPSIIIPDKGSIYKEEVMQARVSLDPGQQPKQVKIDCERYYDSSYGKSAADVMTYGLEEKNVKTGPLGLFGKNVKALVYTQKTQGYWNTNNRLQRVAFDAGTGEVLDYKDKKYALTYPQALKETVFSLPGLGLNAFIIGLCRIPGSLPYAVLGPTGSLVFGISAAAIFSLAVARHKTKAW